MKMRQKKSDKGPPLVADPPPDLPSPEMLRRPAKYRGLRRFGRLGRSGGGVRERGGGLCRVCMRFIYIYVALLNQYISRVFVVLSVFLLIFFVFVVAGVLMFLLLRAARTCPV